MKTISTTPNSSAKSQRFSYAISQIAPLPLVVSEIAVLNRKSQLDTLCFGAQLLKSHWLLSFSAPKKQRFKSQRLQDANATRSQRLAFYKPQRFSATKPNSHISRKHAPKCQKNEGPYGVKIPAILQNPAFTLHESILLGIWGGGFNRLIELRYGEKKTDKEKSHKGIWRSGCPGGVPGTNSGRPRDTWDIWAWFMCKSMLKGQNVPGADGTYHGTDGTCPRDRRDAHQGVSRQNSLCLLVFFFPDSLHPRKRLQLLPLKSLDVRAHSGAGRSQHPRVSLRNH